MLQAKKVVLGLLVLLTIGAGVSRADILSGCGTCQGARYALVYDPSTNVSGVSMLDKNGNSTTGTVYDVFLFIETTNLAIPTATHVQAVSIKISDYAAIPPSSLVSAPGGAAGWNFSTGGINSGGCDGAGAGFICAQDPVPYAATLPHTGVYFWEFHYATPNSILLGNLASDIKVQYADATGTKAGALVSEGITLQECPGCGPTITPFGTTPEPASIGLFAGVLILTFRSIRKRVA